MKIFYKEKAAFLRKNNQRSIQNLCIFLAVTILICVLCVCLVGALGRFLCQLTATVTSSLFGCFCLIQMQVILHRRRVISLCEKTPGPVYTCLVQGAETRTTTIGKLPFYGLDIDVGGTRKTLFLYCEADPTALVGNTVTVTAWNHIILELEVVA